MGPGGAVLSNLQHTLYYDNLFYEAGPGKSAKSIKPGIKTTITNKPIFLESIQHRLMNGTIKINSRRFVQELTTFIYNPQTRRAEPSPKGKHDDAIMAVCFAIYVRDSVMRDVPMGADVPKELSTPFKTTIYEEIKKEILEGAPKDLISNNDPTFMPDDETLAGVVFNFKRKHDKILKEFGWCLIPFMILLEKLVNLIIL